ncbi:tagaturonate reductase [Mucilaginibacter puniceus]
MKMNNDTNIVSQQRTQLSNRTLATIKAFEVVKPGIDYLKLPVKVLQFGTGVLLRGLTDHVIDKANREGVFNGRITVVKSTNTGSTDAFAQQDNLYTLHIKGIKNKHLSEEAIINTSISQVLSAADEWNLVLKQAESIDLKVVISNTTEVGLQLVKENINQQPPSSFPAKLLAVLYHRYKAFNGDKESGLVIIPTELLPNNGTILKSIITELIAFNKLGADFEKWVNESNYFCNSLVDRIVTGRPSPEEQELFEAKNGYHDELLIVSEPYLLWAIEGDEKVRSILSFEQVNDGVIVIPDIEVHRELKLRLLNGTHTLSTALAFLSGFDVVNASTNDAQFEAFLKNLMAEIRSAMPKADPKLAEDFADSVLDRFRNPFIQHQWIAIAQQYTTKIITRVLPLLKQYYSIYNQVPVNITKGFAAYLALMSKVVKDGNGFIINHNGVNYPFSDGKAGQVIEKYQTYPIEEIATKVLSDSAIWGEDITQLPMFADAVQNEMNKILKGI